MTTRCPDGHESSTDDYCDVCGVILASVGATEARPAAAPEAEPEVASASEPAAAPAPGPPPECPACGSPRSTSDAFCEECGLDFAHGEAPTASVPITWRVTITADRNYFDLVATESMAFPADLAPRTLDLDADELTIGRGSQSQGVQPTIDLGAPVDDPGVSHHHARLVRNEDGTYSVIDDGSTNGTTINDDRTPIEPGVLMRLRAGDRVSLGAWTVLSFDVVKGDT